MDASPSWTDFDKTPPVRNPLWGCKLCKLLDEVTPEERAVIQKVLEDRAYSQRVIRDRLRVRGVRVSPEKISDHRAGRCST